MLKKMKKQVLINALSQGIGKACTAITSFIIVKIITSIGTELYGQYVIAYEYLAFFGIIADSGLFAIAVREMTKKPEQTEFIMSNILSMRLILIIGVTLIAGLSAQFISAYPQTVQIGIWITGISMALTIVAGTLASVLQARMKIYWFSFSLVVGKIILAALIFWLFLNPQILQNQLHPLLWVGVLSNIVFCGLIIWFTSREVKLSLGRDITWWKEIFKTSLPYGIALILQTLYLRIDVVLISIVLGIRATALYGGATRILESFLVLGTFFGQAFLPEITRQESSLSGMNKSISWGLIMLSFIALPIIIGITAFSPDLILLLATPDLLTNDLQTGSDSVILVLIPTVLFAYFNQLFTFTLVSQNRQKRLLMINAVALGLNAFLNIVFLKHFGIIAAAWTTIFCEIIVFALLTKEILQRFKITLPLKPCLLLLLSNGILLTLIYGTPLRNHLLLSALIGGSIYGSIVWMNRSTLLKESV